MGQPGCHRVDDQRVGLTSIEVKDSGESAHLDYRPSAFLSPHPPGGSRQTR
jgi:hypothetical protein